MSAYTVGAATIVGGDDVLLVLGKQHLDELGVVDCAVPVSVIFSDVAFHLQDRCNISKGTSMVRANI